MLVGQGVVLVVVELEAAGYLVVIVVVLLLVVAVYLVALISEVPHVGGPLACYLAVGHLVEMVSLMVGQLVVLWLSQQELPSLQGPINTHPHNTHPLNTPFLRRWVLRGVVVRRGGFSTPLRVFLFLCGPVSTMWQPPGRGRGHLGVEYLVLVVLVVVRRQQRVVVLECTR